MKKPTRTPHARNAISWAELARRSRMSPRATRQEARALHVDLLGFPPSSDDDARDVLDLMLRRAERRIA